MNDALVELPEFPPGAKGVLWENWPLDKVRSNIPPVCGNIPPGAQKWKYHTPPTYIKSV